MNARLRFLLALLLAAAMPLTALAQNHQNSRGTGRSAPARSAPARSAPVRSAPSRAVTAPPSRGGFDLSRDVAAPQSQAARPAYNRQPAGRPSYNQPRNSRPVYTRPGSGPYAGRTQGARISNPRYGNARSWGWNNGMAWNAAPAYWGGGFWGAFAIASLASALIYGSIDYDQQVYPSYEVTPDSPGAEMLQSYGLQQTPCGPPNLVVIWGPDNSVICTYPNNLVAPGNYELDPSTLTLVATQ